MLGNDLVDLKQAKLDSNWRRKGYLDKIFSQKEQLLIANTENSDQFVWLFWSMKEAAYKIVNRLTGRRFYAPKHFECSLDYSAAKPSGKVIYQDDIFFTNSEIKEELIHTTARVSQKIQLQSYYSSNSTCYLEEFNAQHTSFQLSKNNAGLPMILNRLTGLITPASVSHHGRFLAIVVANSLDSKSRERTEC